MVKRPFIDAPAWLRCTARVQLSDKTYAQCGRYRNADYARNCAVGRTICTQHGGMLLRGRPVYDFHSGQIMRLHTVKGAR